MATRKEKDVVTVWQGDEINLFQLLEDRRVESERRNEVLHKRIGELRDEMAQKIEESHKEIMQEIRELRLEQQKHASEMSSRISRLERWKWTIIGGSAVLGFIIAKSDAFSKLLS